MNEKLINAMILAAGYGTRLKPLTDSIPKPLVPYKGKPMIHHVILKLISEGITSIVINTHHLAGLMEQYFRENDYGIEIKLIYEPHILGTGGGIKNAYTFLKNTDDFLVYNSDIDSQTDIKEMFSFHKKNGSLVTLAVKDRKSSRALLVDDEHNLTGNIVNGEKRIYLKSHAGQVLETSFCGIHIISTALFEHMPAEDKFDIISLYLDLVSKNKQIKCYSIGSAEWKDLGKPENL